KRITETTAQARKPFMSSLKCLVGVMCSALWSRKPECYRSDLGKTEAWFRKKAGRRVADDAPICSPVWLAGHRFYYLPVGAKGYRCAVKRGGTSLDGAGEGNRTLVVSLGSFCSAIELHPRAAHSKQLRQARQ